MCLFACVWSLRVCSPLGSWALKTTCALIVLFVSGLFLVGWLLICVFVCVCVVAMAFAFGQLGFDSLIYSKCVVLVWFGCFFGCVCVCLCVG